MTDRGCTILLMVALIAWIVIVWVVGLMPGPGLY
jgi:hypothetical protein